MRLLSLLLSLLMGTSATQATYPAPGPGRQANSCTAPTMTYRWTPTSGCSTSTPCATDQVSGNNASQTTSGDLPTYGATCGPNSTPCLTFNGTTDYLLPTTAIAGPTDLTVYAIFKTATTPTTKGYPFIGGAANGIEFGIDTANQAFLNQQDITGTNGTRTYTSGTWYAEAITYHNATTTTNFYAVSGGGLSADGVSASPAMTFSAAAPNLGANTNGSDLEYFNGSIAEWGYLSSVNTAGIAAWSSCHYGV